MTTQTLISEIETLPKECLTEVSNFVAFLRYKAQVADVKVVYANLEEGYRAMAADEEYEKEAQEWINGYFKDTWDD
jgi:hypothetical protein